MRRVIGKVKATINGQSSISIAAQSPLSQSTDPGTGVLTISLDQTNIASKSELAGKVNTSSVGTANGIAGLDANGKVPYAQLPWDGSVISGYNDLASFPATGQTGRLYIAHDTNLFYRWDGSQYVAASPFTTEMQAALDAKVNSSLIGASQGIAELDVNSKVPVTRLPGFTTAFPTTGEIGKIYVDGEGKLFEWNGTAYIQVGGDKLRLGTTHTTAFRGDFGEVAYNHVGSIDNPHNVTKSQVGLGNVPNVATNDQTPTYTKAGSLTALSSGETFSVAMGKLAKAVDDEISHHGNTDIHFTVAERQKLQGIEAQAQVNEVTTEQFASSLGIITFLCSEVKRAKAALSRLATGITGTITGTVEGTKGFGYMPDAANGSITSIKVDPSLSGTTIYVQVRYNATNTWQQGSATANSSGVVNVSSLSTVNGINEIYVSKTAYVWTLPSTSGGSAKSTTIGTDGYPTNGVDFTAVYNRDMKLGIEVDYGYYNEDEFLQAMGYRVTYAAYTSTALAITAYNSGEKIYVKSPADKYGSRETYYQINQVPSSTSTQTYYKRALSYLE